MARIKKSSDSYTAYARGGAKMKGGGKLPDFNKDGKITKKDVLIGRGVLPKTAKKGMKITKAQSGSKLKPDYDPLEKQRMKDLMKKGPVYDTIPAKKKPTTPSKDYENKQKPIKKTSVMKKGGSVMKKAMGGMSMMKKGGKMSKGKKCRYGC